MKLSKIKKGFTFVELLLVLTIISTLLIAVFAALNPISRLQESRNAIRWDSVNSLLTAIHECIVDNGGSLSACGLIDNNLIYQIGTCTTGADVNCTEAETACVDLRVTNTLDRIPTDPMAGTPATGYSVSVSGGVVTVASCLSEGGESIFVSR